MRTTVATLILVELACFPAIPLLSQPPTAPRISTFAPAGDLIQQVDFFVGRVKESLADAGDFDAAKQSRTVKDANTLAVLALMLGVHDEQHRLKAGAGTIVVAAQSLAAAGEDHQRAKQAFDRIVQARAGQAADGPAVQWAKSADLASLMKQVPLIHTGLKRGVDPKRLARTAAQAAGQSAALAAIAAAATLDDQYAKTPQDAEKWRALCVEMRDAAAAVNSAVHAQDQQRLDGGMRRLSHSCDECHAKFRK